MSSGDPERHLHEILSFSYEAALEAGLAPKNAFAIIANWLAIKQLHFENAPTSSQHMPSHADLR